MELMENIRKRNERKKKKSTINWPVNSLRQMIAIPRLRFAFLENNIRIQHLFFFLKRKKKIFFF
jgi:hypothetical protein